MRLLCLVLAMLFACREAGSPMQPFQIPQWTSRPSAEQLENAIVGTGGSSLEREAARRAVRDLMLPALEQLESVETLRFRLENLRAEFEDAQEPEPATRLIRVAVRDELGRLRERAMMLAEKRLHMMLWPGQQVPEEWDGISDLEPLPTIDSTVAAATSTEQRLGQVRARYGIVQIGEERSELLILNYLHVAKTGDYAQTTEPIYGVLMARGVPTTPLPGANPW